MSPELSQAGFALHHQVLTPAECAGLIAALATPRPDSLSKSQNRRHLLREVPAIAALAASGVLMELAREYLQAPAFAVRGLLFDKTDGANWSVAWHQDVTIAVRTRIDTDGFSGWSTKDGIIHVHPPAAVLERMVSIRVHLDDCGEDNGALEVLPGSHRDGILDERQMGSWRENRSAVLCSAGAGDVLVMRPLLLHASRRAMAPRHRRVLHLEYSSAKLPNGLEWFDRVA